jgi:hypothetical protein
MCLIAEVNAAYGRVLQIDVADAEDEWFGYNLMSPNVIENHTSRNCSLGVDVDMDGEDQGHAMSATGNSTGLKTGFMPRRLDNSSSFLWPESKESIWSKYEILADDTKSRTRWEMLNIVWGNGPSPPGDVRDGFT